MKKESDYATGQKVWENPIALAGEEVFFVQRKHWIVLLPIIASLSMVSIIFLSGMNVLLFVLGTGWFSSLALSLAAVAAYATLLVKVVTEWYFAVYILTSRRLLEVCYTPLTSYILNDVLLDQVRCTEIDIETNGLIFKYLDIGDITITFDRPTHQEAFTLRSIKDFHKLSTQLCGLLLPPKQLQPAQSLMQTVWLKPKKQHKRSIPVTEILPGGSIFAYPSV